MSEFEKQIKNKFGEVVNKDKEMAELALDAVARADRMSKEAARIAKIKHLKSVDIATLSEQPKGKSWTVDKPMADHSSVTMGFRDITVDNGRLVAKIGFTNPETGRHSTRTRRGETDSLEDVIIARNALAATMFKADLIDFEHYLKIVRG